MSRDIAEISKCQKKHGGRGPSSFWMQDSDIAFGALHLAPGEIFLDMGCGPGDYAIKAAGIVGPGGRVLAVDASSQMISSFSARVEQEGLANVKVLIADITRPLAIEDKSVDVCFLSTVLHIFDLEQVGEELFKEIRRVLRPTGRMAILECKKEDLPFGPPLEMRLSADEISAIATKMGFTRAGYLDLGYNYLVHFVLASVSYTL